MRRRLLLTVCLIATFAILPHHTQTRAAKSSPSTPALPWNPKLAAGYLDQRASWWFTWPRAQRDRDTFCISCHTSVPYAMSRATLRTPLGEDSPSQNERRLFDNVTKRVRLWREVEPFYSDQDRGPYKSIESRGTESVLNALILACHDAQSGRLSDDTLTAFSNMWAEQVAVDAARPATQSMPVSPRASSTSVTTAPSKTNYDHPSPTSNAASADAPDQFGAWRWLRFRNEPWEADDSDFYGAALAAIAVGTAPENYRSRPEIRHNVELLRDYLSRHSSAEPLINRIVHLWASAKLPGLLDSTRQTAILEEIVLLQQSDGGWSLSSLTPSWQRHDNTPQDLQTDGYATGLIAFVLQQLPRTEASRAVLDGVAGQSSVLDRALAWLASHQNGSTGSWPSASLNNNPAHHISPDTVLFMNDAATSYALLALTSSTPATLKR